MFYYLSISIQFSFADYLHRLYRLADITLVNTDTVTVSEIEFLRNVSLLINRASPRTLQNYMVWRLMMDLVQYMPKSFRKIKEKFDEVFEGIIADDERELTCASYVNKLMGFAVAKLYTQKYFDKNTRIQVI